MFYAVYPQLERICSGIKVRFAKKPLIKQTLLCFVRLFTVSAYVMTMLHLQTLYAAAVRLLAGCDSVSRNLYIFYNQFFALPFFTQDTIFFHCIKNYIPKAGRFITVIGWKIILENTQGCFFSSIYFKYKF